jgi:hypothetical protein
MPEQLVTCPNCGEEFEVGDVLTESIREQLRRELEGDLVKKQEDLKKRIDEAREREKALSEKAEAIEDTVAERLEEERKKVVASERKRAEQELKVQLDDLQEQLDERGKKLEEAAKRETEFLKKQRELDEKAQTLDLEVEKRLDEERKQIAEAAKKQAEGAFTRKNREVEEKLEGLQEQLEERDKKLDEARKKEMEFLKKERELQEKERSMELEIERRLTEAQGPMHEEAIKKAHEAQQLKMREKDDLIEKLRSEMQDMQRRMEQGSQERQGEALEGQLQDVLSGAFPFDHFEEVKKGARGADIVQTVHNNQGRVCGKLLWEAKNAKNFQPAWLSKLKEDQVEAGANLAVLMTVALPPEVQQFSQVEDGPMWVTDYASALGLCAALRQQLISVHREKLMAEHGETVKDVLFEYVTGQDFNLRVRAMVDTYVTMQQDLESEKRALTSRWKKREKLIGKILENISGMHGELEALVGTQTALPAVKTLSIEHLEDEDEDDQTESIEEDEESAEGLPPEDE